LPGTAHTRSGVRPTITGGVASSSPTTKATKYVDILMVSAKRTTLRPSPNGSSDTIEVLEMATSRSGTTRVTENTALNAGSSQQGNARRASVASNWVAAIVCITPAGSLYVLR
jgi:hypothetical protein